MTKLPEKLHFYHEVESKLRPQEHLVFAGKETTPEGRFSLYVHLAPYNPSHPVKSLYPYPTHFNHAYRRSFIFPYADVTFPTLLLHELIFEPHPSLIYPTKLWSLSLLWLPRLTLRAENALSTEMKNI